MTSAETSEEIELDRLHPSGSRTDAHSGMHASGPLCPPRKLTWWALFCSPFTTIQRILTFITTMIPYLSRFNLKSSSPRRQLPPQDTASRFIREFEELYGPRHVPFENRGYTEVTQHVKEKDIYLLLVLISEEHDDTVNFCKQV